MAHLIADFPLQTDKIFVMKLKYPWGVAVHASVAGALGFLLAGRYLRYPEVLIGLLVLWMAHILIDKGKLMLNRRLEKERIDLFLADQAFHIGLIWLFVHIVDLRQRLLIDVRGLSSVYNSDVAVKLLCGYIVATYGVMLFVYSIKSTLGLRPDLPRLKQRLVEFLERGSVVTLTILGGLFWLLIPLCLAPRAVLSFGRSGRYRRLEFVLSAAFSLLIGILLKELVI